MNQNFLLSHCLRIFVSFCLLGILAAEPSGVEFPGIAPGKARSHQDGAVFSIENEVLAALWEMRDGQLRPLALTNKLTKQTMKQVDAELFRLSTQPAQATTDRISVMLRLERDRIVVLASKDARLFAEVADFPRADFPGEPKMIRVGKMDLKAQSRDYPGDQGKISKGRIERISPMPPEQKDSFDFETLAHRAATMDYAFPAGTTRVSAMIDKGTDTGLSWSPAIALIWEEGKSFVLVGLREKSGVLNITTAKGESIKQATMGTFPAGDLRASQCKFIEPVRFVAVPAKRDSARLADAFAGVALEVKCVTSSGLHALWRAELRDGSNYFRQTLELRSASASVSLHGVELLDVKLPEARTVGTAPGCPVAAAGFFLGVEMPGAQNLVDDLGAQIGFSCQLQVTPLQPYRFGAVVGIAPQGQLRRAFLCYMERERARASKPFLHYNGWYDLGYGVDGKKLLDVVKSFDAELVKKRGVPVSSYLVDDGWDDPAKGLWQENVKRFPEGFVGLKKSMSHFNASLGIWISPLGGYGGDKERTALAQQMGLLPANVGFDLSYPKYRDWFAERCLQLMRDGGVNSFKWDRAGEGVSPHFMALLEVAQRLRQQNPEVFINVTVGTWPSPFWLNHVDSTWRMGSADVGWAGKGDDREQWLTFRDGYCHKLFVELSPLYPLNSVMHHGIVHGREFQAAKVSQAGGNLRHEARSYFANGAMLQELYLTPSMMSDDAWDDVAAAAKWAHARADVLRDAHWVGGDPLLAQPYGIASWSPTAGTLMLRNPDAVAQSISLDAATVFELPADAKRSYKLQSPYADQRIQTLALTAGSAKSITLEPFEVLVFDAQAQ